MAHSLCPTPRIIDPAPIMINMQPSRYRQVRCIRFVRLSHAIKTDKPQRGHLKNVRVSRRVSPTECCQERKAARAQCDMPCGSRRNNPAAPAAQRRPTLLDRAVSSKNLPPVLQFGWAWFFHRARNLAERPSHAGPVAENRAAEPKRLPDVGCSALGIVIMSCLCLSLVRVQSAQEPINGSKYSEIQYRANNKSNPQNRQNRETPL